MVRGFASGRTMCDQTTCVKPWVGDESLMQSSFLYSEHFQRLSTGSGNLGLAFCVGRQRIALAHSRAGTERLQKRF